MTFRCLILGCKFKTKLEFWSIGEYLITKQCTRCGATRTITK